MLYSLVFVVFKEPLPDGNCCYVTRLVVAGKRAFSEQASYSCATFALLCA